LVILWPFYIIFPVLVQCAEKHLATPATTVVLACTNLVAIAWRENHEKKLMNEKSNIDKRFVKMRRGRTPVAGLGAFLTLTGNYFSDSK
jgi:hypothetical protein